jgi:hypothetical protein
MSFSTSCAAVSLIEAVRAFLDEHDHGSMEFKIFHARLQPCRIVTRQVTRGGSMVCTPILTLENPTFME